MTVTHEALEKYQQLPISGVASNEPYGVGTDAVEATKRREAKDNFIDSTADWPEINYPLLDSKTLWEAERDLWNLLNEIIADKEIEPAKKETAYEQIAIKLAEVYRHLEIARGLGSAAVHQELSQKRAGDMTLELFGEPQQEMFEALLGADRTTAKAIATADPRKQIADEFLELTGEVQGNGEITDRSFELNDEAMEIIRGDFDKLFPGFGEFISQDIESEVGAEEAVSYFTQALSVFELAKKGVDGGT